MHSVAASSALGRLEPHRPPSASMHRSANWESHPPGSPYPNEAAHRSSDKSGSSATRPDGSNGRDSGKFRIGQKEDARESAATVGRRECPASTARTTRSLPRNKRRQKPERNRQQHPADPWPRSQPILNGNCYCPSSRDSLIAADHG